MELSGQSARLARDVNVDLLGNDNVSLFACISSFAVDSVKQ